MKPNLRRMTKPRAFVLLMVLAGVACLLPPAWTGWANVLAQPAAWPKAGVHAVAAGAAHAVRSAVDGGTVPRSDYDALAAKNEQLARQILHQQLTIREQMSRIGEISGLREAFHDTPASFRLASPIGGQTTPTRETMTISAGSLQDVRVGDWVAAGAALKEEGADLTGRELVYRQWLIGRVESVRRHESDVLLSTDAGFGSIKVHVARIGSDGALEVSATPCPLYGAGGGRMIIRAATEDYLAAGMTAVVVPLGGVVPTMLTIGRIVSSRRVETTGLHYDLEVRPVGNARGLSHVYVLQLDR